MLYKQVKEYAATGLTTIFAGGRQDLLSGLLGGEQWRPGHHVADEVGPAGELARLGGQEEVVALARLQVQLVDTGLQVGAGRGQRAQLRPPGGSCGRLKLLLRLDEEQLEALSDAGGVAAVRGFHHLLDLQQRKQISL